MYFCNKRYNYAVHCGIFKATHLPGYCIYALSVYVSHFAFADVRIHPGLPRSGKQPYIFDDDVSSAFGLRCFCAAVRNGVGEKKAVPCDQPQKNRCGLYRLLCGGHACRACFGDNHQCMLYGYNTIISLCSAWLCVRVLFAGGRSVCKYA